MEYVDKYCKLVWFMLTLIKSCMVIALFSAQRRNQSNWTLDYVPDWKVAQLYLVRSLFLVVKWYDTRIWPVDLVAGWTRASGSTDTLMRGLLIHTAVTLCCSHAHLRPTATNILRILEVTDQPSYFQLLLHRVRILSLPKQHVWSWAISIDWFIQLLSAKLCITAKVLFTLTRIFQQLLIWGKISQYKTSIYLFLFISYFEVALFFLWFFSLINC